MNYQPHYTAYQGAVYPNELKVFTHFQLQFVAKLFPLPIFHSGTDEFSEFMRIAQEVMIGLSPYPAVYFILQGSI